jgi:hypothetical protein
LPPPWADAPSSRSSESLVFFLFLTSRVEDWARDVDPEGESIMMVEETVQRCCCWPALEEGSEKGGRSRRALIRDWACYEAA